MLNEEDLTDIDTLSLTTAAGNTATSIDPHQTSSNRNGMSTSEHKRIALPVAHNSRRLQQQARRPPGQELTVSQGRYGNPNQALANYALLNLTHNAVAAVANIYPYPFRRKRRSLINDEGGNVESGCHAPTANTIPINNLPAPNPFRRQPRDFVDDPADVYGLASLTLSPQRNFSTGGVSNPFREGKGLIKGNL
mgnify:CR=1 FL=1